MPAMYMMEGGNIPFSILIKVNDLSHKHIFEGSAKKNEQKADLMPELVFTV